MARKNPSSSSSEGKLSGSQIEGSTELLQVSRQLTQLVVAQQEQPLSPRQREELRRALATAGHALPWAEAATNGDPVAGITSDVIALGEKGFELLERELVEERALKQTEIARLGDVANYARGLAGDPHTVYPTEITYSYTVRDPYQRLITKTAKNTLSDSAEALGAAAALDKSIEGRTKLADLMVIDLEERRQKLRAMRRKLPDFVESSRGLLAEVLANLP